MKKMTKRIVLNRETLRRLDPVKLADAQAGYNYSTGPICHYPSQQPCA
jgi:hypothetical protein